MTRQDQLWEDFNLEANCVAITDQNRVRMYFAQFSLALDCLDRVFETTTGRSNTEYQAIEFYLARLRSTFKLLAWKHFFTGNGSELKIDTTDSGFVHFTTLIELGADLGSRDPELGTIPSSRELKEEMVRRVLEYRTHPRELQVRLARRLYLEQLGHETFIPPFMPGPLVAVGEVDERASYFWSFATYDRSLNRPFIYLVYFVYDRPGHVLGNHDVQLVELEETAGRTAHGRLNLLAFSKALDDGLPWMSPRIVKRVILGPWWSPHYTRNEGDMGTILDQVRDRFPFALRWETETLVSERETRVGGGLFSRGTLKQIFWIPRNLDLQQRGVSHLDRYILFPHWLGQHVAAGRLFEDHRQFVFDKEERVYGIH